jgi:putative membrane protein
VALGVHPGYGKSMAETEPPPEADPRVLLAAERTLLAWIRTGLALMGFGFVVARFGVFLREIATLSGQPQPKPLLGGAAIGVCIVGGGVLLNLWASQRHARMFRRLQQGKLEIGMQGPVTVGVATGVGGVVLFVALALAILR